MKDCVAFLQQNARDGLLPFSIQQDAARLFSMSLKEVEDAALSNNILPSRHQRNSTMISINQQHALLRSSVAVIGCGGLGGYIVEELARIGVGTILVVDPDAFEEHNLNRQLFCTQDVLGRKKVDVAAERVALINPAVKLQGFARKFDHANSAEILHGVTVAADALDSISSRLELAESCNKWNVPLVHGAIAGWSGHVAVQYPGENILQHLYAKKRINHGVEKSLGNPSFTPATIASLEVAEIVKIVIKIEPLQPRRYQVVDLYHSEFTEVYFPESD